MRFKLQTDYAIRALLFLASKRGENCTTEEIASYFEISAAHLGRVIRRLQSHGYVKAIRGRKGGVRLAKDADALTIGEVVETLETQPSQLKEDDGHSMHSPERLAAVLRRTEGMMLNYLRQVSFGELAREGLPPRERPAATWSMPAQPVLETVGSDLRPAAPAPVLVGS